MRREPAWMLPTALNLRSLQIRYQVPRRELLQDSLTAASNTSAMSKQTYTRREWARQAVAGVAGVLLTASLSAPVQAQVVDPAPALPPPLLTPPDALPANEGPLLTQLVPLNVGYTLSDTQAKEVEKQLKDYPGSFAKARAYVLPDNLGPAFAADAPKRKDSAK